MKEFITSQLKLAEALGITPQYLSVVKKSNTASDVLLQKLEEVTGIKQILWASPARRRTLEKELNAFFCKERLKAKTQKR